MRDKLKCNFEEVAKVDGQYILIRDLDTGMSVTNSAEEVVENLVKTGRLHDEECLFYISTDGTVDELGHSCGLFTNYIGGWNNLDNFNKAHKTDYK